MSLRIHLFVPKSCQRIPNFGTNPSSSYPSRTHFINASPKLPISISCTKNNNSFSDAELALELAKEVEKLNSQIVQREEALNKSRELLFKEFSNYMGMGLKADEVKKKWRKMNEDEKWIVADGFVSKWSDNFHPLSAKSVKELVDEYLVNERESLGDSADSMLFSSLKKLMGFSQNNDASKG